MILIKHIPGLLGVFAIILSLCLFSDLIICIPLLLGGLLIIADAYMN